MAYTVIIHIAGEASVTGEVEELPKASDNIIVVTNPRQKDGKDLHYLENNVTKVIWPLAKVSLIEVLESSEEEKIIGFVRE
jgi:UDP-N-acetyl-D-mannosaminuronate dehydrogenase